MGQIRAIAELLEMHGEELKEYLLTLSAADRRRICKELLETKEAMDGPELADNLNESG